MKPLEPGDLIIKDGKVGIALRFAVREVFDTSNGAETWPVVRVATSDGLDWWKIDDCKLL